MIVVIAKRMGFSFDELNELSVQALVDIANVYKGEDKNAPPKMRRATQVEIDNFLG